MTTAVLDRMAGNAPHADASEAGRERAASNDITISSLLAAEHDYSGRDTLEGFRNASFFSLVPFVLALAFSDAMSFFRSRFAS